MPEKWLFPIFLCHILSQWPSVAWLAQLLSSSMDATSSLCKLLGFLFRQVPRRAIHPGLQCSEAMSIQPARYLHLHFQSPIYIRIIPVWPGWGTPHIFGGGFLDNYRDWQSHSPGPHSCSQGVFFFFLVSASYSATWPHLCPLFLCLQQVGLSALLPTLTWRSQLSQKLTRWYSKVPFLATAKWNITNVNLCVNLGNIKNNSPGCKAISNLTCCWRKYNLAIWKRKSF